MQCQALVVNSSEELVLVHSLYNAEDVLKNAEETKHKKLELKDKTQQYWGPSQVTFACTQQCLIDFEL